MSTSRTRHASCEEATIFQEAQASILRKYLSEVGERRRSANPYTHKRLVNSMNSSYHVQFEPNDTVYEYADKDVEDEQAKLTSPESLARDIYTMSGGRPKFEVGNAKPTISSPMISNELHKALPDDEVIKSL